MRLIDADALLKRECEADKMAAMLVVGKGYILDAPTVDAVSVVRCKDCCHYYKYGDWDRSRSESYEAGECRLFNEDFGLEGYCSKGEAKCKNYILEEDRPYPLCVNKECDKSKTCNISAYMDEEPYWEY